MIDMIASQTSTMNNLKSMNGSNIGNTSSSSNYLDKIRKLENEKHNLVFQVQLLQQQLNINSTTTPQHYSTSTNNNNRINNNNNDELQFLKSQLKNSEQEKEFYFNKFKEYQEENNILKARLQDFDSNSSSSFNKFNYIDESKLNFIM